MFPGTFDSDQAAVSPQAVTWLMLHEGTNTKSFDFRECDCVCLLDWCRNIVASCLNFFISLQNTRMKMSAPHVSAHRGCV